VTSRREDQCLTSLPDSTKNPRFRARRACGTAGAGRGRPALVMAPGAGPASRAARSSSEVFVDESRIAPEGGAGSRAGPPAWRHGRARHRTRAGRWHTVPLRGTGRHGADPSLALELPALPDDPLVVRWGRGEARQTWAVLRGGRGGRRAVHRRRSRTDMFNRTPSGRRSGRSRRSARGGSSAAVRRPRGSGLTLWRRVWTRVPLHPRWTCAARSPSSWAGRDGLTGAWSGPSSPARPPCRWRASRPTA